MMTVRFTDKNGHHRVITVAEVEVSDFGVCEAKGNTYKFREMNDTYSAEVTE